MNSKSFTFRYSILLLFVGIYTRLSSGQPTIDPSAQKVQVLVGTQNVKLDCLVPNQPNVDVYWYVIGVNTESIISKNENSMYLNSYEIEFDRPTNNYRLVIKIVNRLFEGYYSCKFRTISAISHVPIVTVVTISVEAFNLPSDPKVEIDIEQIDAVEGDAVALMCSAFIGDIPGSFEFWMVDKNNMHHNMCNNSILLQQKFNFVMLKVNVTRNMAAIQCNVKHHLLSNVLTHSTPQLNVLFRPQFLNVITYEDENNLYIIFNLTSNPKARISSHCWQNKKMVDNTTCRHAAIVEKNNLFQWTLPTNGGKTDSEIATILELQANNDIGNDRHVIKLHWDSVDKRDIVTETYKSNRPIEKKANEKMSLVKAGIIIGVIVALCIGLLSLVKNRKCYNVREVDRIKIQYV